MCLETGSYILGSAWGLKRLSLFTKNYKKSLFPGQADEFQLVDLQASAGAGVRRRTGRFRNPALFPPGQQGLKFLRGINVAASRAARFYPLSRGVEDDLPLLAMDAFHNFHSHRERLGSSGSTWRHSLSRAFK